MSKQYPHSEYAGLGMLIHIEWQYLQIIVTEVGFLMGPIEDALREALLPEIFTGGGGSAPTTEKS